MRLIDLDRVSRTYDHFVVARRVDRPISQLYHTLSDGSRVLDIECIGKIEPGISMNLYGTRFSDAHLIHRQTTPGSDPWRGENIDINDFQGCYTQYTSAFPLMYSSKSLHRKVFPHDHSVNDEKQHDSIHKAGAAIGAKYFDKYPSIKTLWYEVFIHHVPTNLNYWHVQLEVKPAGKRDYRMFTKQNMPKWAKKIFRESLVKILKSEFIHVPDYPVPQLTDCVACYLFPRCK